jgi:cytoskeletal protein RodZ
VHRTSGRSLRRDLQHLERHLSKGRPRNLPSRRQDTPWAALLISLLGLVAAIVAARVTQLPANDPPQVLVAPVMTDPPTAGEPTAEGTQPPPTTPGADLTPEPTTLRPTTVTRTRVSPSATGGPTAAAPAAPAPAAAAPAAPAPAAAAPAAPAPAAPAPAAPAPTICRSSFSIQSAWNGGMVAQLTLTNTSARAWTTWSGGFSMSSVATVQYSWGATMHSAGGWVSVTPADYNASVPAGSTISLGFQALTTAPIKQFGALTVNGTTCRPG